MAKQVRKNILILFLSLLTVGECLAQENAPDPCEQIARKEANKTKPCKEMIKIDEEMSKNKAPGYALNMTAIKQYDYECERNYQMQYLLCTEKQEENKHKRAAKLAKMKFNDYYDWLKPKLPIEDCQNPFDVSKWGAFTVDCDKNYHCVCRGERGEIAKRQGEAGCTESLNTFSKMVNNAKANEPLDCQILREHIKVVAISCNAVGSEKPLKLNKLSFNEDNLKTIVNYVSMYSTKCNINDDIMIEKQKVEPPPKPVIQLQPDTKLRVIEHK